MCDKSFTEEEARKILGEISEDGSSIVYGDDNLTCFSPYVIWDSDGDDESVALDGHYSVDELRAIVWWIDNKSKRKS